MIGPGLESEITPQLDRPLVEPGGEFGRKSSLSQRERGKGGSKLLDVLRSSTVSKVEVESYDRDALEYRADTSDDDELNLRRGQALEDVLGESLHCK